MNPRPDIANREYAGAVLVTLAATVVRLLLQPFIGSEFPFITYFAAVFVSAWWFGFKPTLLTVLLSAFLTNLLFFSPTGSDSRAGDLLGLVGLALFVGIGVGTAYMGKGRLDAQHRAETAAAAAQRLQAVAEDEAARAEEETTRADEESARAQSGNRFFVLSRDLFCTLGFDGYFKDLNPAWEPTLGYTRAELLARPLIEFIHPDDQLATANEAEKLTTGRDLAAFENRYRCKDGSYRSFVWSATAVIDDQLIYGAGRDITDRKLAEAVAELGKTERQLSAMLGNLELVSMMLDREARITYCNDYLLRLTGWQLEEVIGQSWPELFLPSDVVDELRGVFAALLTDQAAAWHHENEIVTRAGTRRLIRWNNSLLRSASGDVIGTASLGEDITEQRRAEVALEQAHRELSGADHIARKQAEEALLKARALESAILNSANFSCIATDAKGVIQIFNVGAERMMGYAAEEVVNKITPAALHDPQEVIARAAALSLEYASPIAPGFEALVFKAARRIKDVYELTKVRKDGSRFPAVVSVSALRDAQDGIIGYLLVGTDNTAQKQVEEQRKKFEDALRQSEERFRGLVTASSDVVYRMSPDWTEMRQLHGQNFLVDTNAASGTWFQEYIHPDDQPQVRAVINEAIRTKNTFELEHRVRRVDGTFGWTFSRAVPLSDAKGEIVEWFGAASDVTERKLLEQALQQKNVELEDASRMKSEFLANMSHELRTPLNSIIGFSEVLRDGLVGEMTGQQRGFMGDIFSSGNHLLSLINDILDLSKVEAGKMTLDLEPLQVSSLFVNSLTIIREKAAARGIRLHTDAAEGLGAIQLDGRKVKQIVYNLLSNAVKFSIAGGQVTLRAVRVPRAEVGRLSSSWTGRSLPLADNEFADFLKISVTDTGIGISPAGMEHLFKPFSQIDSGLARKFEGTGLGLVMVKLMAELHGGAVAVESAVGEGSCFTVWLPLRTPGWLTSAKAPPAPRSEAPVGERIALVVEGDFKSADLIRVQLDAEGFKVLHAASAEAALVLAIQQPLALITLDIMLPNMDGWEFLSRIKRVPALRRIPVVIISIAADRNKGFSLGAAAVLEKPISRQALYESLVDLGLFPLTKGRTLKVLVVDDDAKAVELIAVRIKGLASTVLRAYGGREAIDTARRELPDVMVIDLMMPEVTGFDVVEALKKDPGTARIPILVVTAKRITVEDRAKLSGYVTTIMEKAEFDPERFIAEVRRAMWGRPVAA